MSSVIMLCTCNWKNYNVPLFLILWTPWWCWKDRPGIFVLFSYLICSDSCGKAKVNMKKEAADVNATHTLVTFTKTSLLLSLSFGRGCLCKRQEFVWPEGSLLQALWEVGISVGSAFHRMISALRSQPGSCCSRPREQPRRGSLCRDPGWVLGLQGGCATLCIRVPGVLGWCGVLACAMVLSC